MKTEELIQVVDRELDSLRYNIKAIRDRKRWTGKTEAIFLRFRYEEEALQEIRTILSQMPDEKGPLTLEQLREKNGKPVWCSENCEDCIAARTTTSTKVQEGIHKESEEET